MRRKYVRHATRYMRCTLVTATMNQHTVAIVWLWHDGESEGYKSLTGLRLSPLQLYLCSATGCARLKPPGVRLAIVAAR